MTKNNRDRRVSHHQPSLFLLSFRHRDELAEIAGHAGWRTIAARRADSAEHRFLASEANIAVIDARGAFQDGISAVHAIAGATEVNAAALLVLISADNLDNLDALYDAGATHYLTTPFQEAEFLQALRFAARHAERLGGGSSVRDRNYFEQQNRLSWHYHPQTGLGLSNALRKLVGDTTQNLATLVRQLDRTERSAARSAIIRMRTGARSTAFAHIMRGKGGGRVAHHLYYDAESGVISGSIEKLDNIVQTTERMERGHRDIVTGLRDGVAARRWIDTKLKKGTHLTLLLLSISRFDMVNAAFGRTTGDSLLRSAARRIERLMIELIGSKIMLARVAGAEFAIAIEGDISADRAKLLAEDISRTISRPFVAGDHMVPLSCRIGVAVSGAGDVDAAGFLRRTSMALAEARTHEGTMVSILDDNRDEAMALDNRLNIDLRRALDQDEIELVFQPQISVTSGLMIGVEALARWRHPDFGELGAETLFSTAERSDYLVQLSTHVQRRAVEIAARWPEKLSHLRLSINVTSADIAVSGFAENLLQMVDRSGFPRDRLTVEITEGGLITDIGHAAALLATLRAGGCRVAIDDFGTGYSSLAYLKSLPLDYLKIDKKLAEDITGSSRDRVVVRGVIEMARSLGLSVVAEGVETQEQLSLLAADGCNYYQGFLFSEPVDVKALEALV